MIRELFPDEDLMLIYGSEILLLVKKEEQADELFAVDLDELMRKYAKSYMVTLPIGIRQKLLTHTENSPLIRKIIADNRLPLAVVRYLERS